MFVTSYDTVCAISAVHTKHTYEKEWRKKTIWFFFPKIVEKNLWLRWKSVEKISTTKKNGKIEEPNLQQFTINDKIKNWKIMGEKAGKIIAMAFRCWLCCRCAYPPSISTCTMGFSEMVYTLQSRFEEFMNSWKEREQCAYVKNRHASI